MKKIRLNALQPLFIVRTKMDNQIVQADISINPNTLAHEIKTFVEATVNEMRLNLWKEAAYCKMNTKSIYLRVEVNVDIACFEYFDFIEFNDFYELEVKIENVTASIKRKMLHEISWCVLSNKTYGSQEWGEQ